MSEGDRDALYDRLKTKNRKDPLSRAFHYRFDRGTINHELLPALNPDHLPPGEAGKQVKSTNQSAGGGTARVAERKAEGTARQAELETKMKASRFEQSIKSFIQDSYDGKTAIEGLQKLQILETASKEELKQVITGAEQWHPDNRKVLDTYLTQSPDVMKRIGKEFPRKNN